jgi:hypothetical protein
MSGAMSGAIWLALAACLSAQVPEAAPPPDTMGPTGPTWVRPLEPQTPDAAASPAQPEEPKPRFVFGFMPGLSMGLNVLPSFDLPFFFGGRLKARPWALGYQGTLTVGGADRYFFGYLTHRHHITAQRGFRDRGFVGVGGGVALLLVRPVIEVEGRVALRFGPKRRGIVGGLARLGWNVAYGERAPVPQFGLFLGVSTL